MPLACRDCCRNNYIRIDAAVAFTFFFGTKNLRAQTAMTVLLSLLIFSELLITIAVDYPFTGPIKVEPTAHARVLADFAPVRGAGPAR